MKRLSLIAAVSMTLFGCQPVPEPEPYPEDETAINLPDSRFVAGEPPPLAFTTAFPKAELTGSHHVDGDSAHKVWAFELEEGREDFLRQLAMQPGVLLNGPDWVSDGYVVLNADLTMKEGCTLVDISESGVLRVECTNSRSDLLSPEWSEDELKMFREGDRSTREQHGLAKRTEN